MSNNGVHAAVMRDDGNPLVSVVTPSYNAAQYLYAAYKSLCSQTYENWEWVVVDDGSSDGSHDLLTKLSQQDVRVRCFFQKNYGNAKYARDHAVVESRGEWIVNLDADDRFLSKDYLEMILKRQQETASDIVYPQMLFFEEDTGRQTVTLPIVSFDAGRVWVGRDLVRYTLPDWQIGCNGGLYRREIVSRLSYPERKEPLWINSDEVDERFYLLDAQKVAFADIKYYYRIHRASVTKAFSAKLFQTLQTDMQLLDLTQNTFGTESDEYRGAHRVAFNDWRAKIRLLFLRHYELESAEPLVWQYLAQLFTKLNPQQLTLSERLRWFNLCSFRMLMLLRGLTISPYYIVGKLVQRLFPRFYNQHFERSMRQRRLIEQLSKAYSNNDETNDYYHSVVCMFEGNHSGGGLIDRLRGVVSTFQVCMATGQDFRLYFVHPFDLTDYLIPNTYDWRIAKTQVTHSPSKSKFIVADTLTDQPWERQWLLRHLKKQLSKSTHLQRHVYSNAAFCYDSDFGSLFNELFKPAPRLSALIESTISKIDGQYITVSARFGTLMDDFNEENYGLTLSPDERRQLLDQCESQVQAIYEKHVGDRVVICSDSVTFIDRMKHFDYVFTIPGTITHIDNDFQRGYEYYEKTFLDFYIISRAQCSYLLHGPNMSFSGFPYAAARLGGHILNVINF